MKKFYFLLIILLLSSGIVLAQSSECEENVDANNDTEVTDNLIQASKNVTIVRKLYDREVLKVTSGEVIELLPGFENEYGATIEAEILGCQPPGSGDPCQAGCVLIGLRNPSEEQCCFEWLDNENINSSVRWVCPDMTTTYTLRVIQTDGNTEEFSYTVEVENVEFTEETYYICEGQNSVELALTESYETYAWAEKTTVDDEPFISTASTFTVSTAGTYGVTVTDFDGCELTGEVEVEAAENPEIIFYTNDPTICVIDSEVTSKTGFVKSEDCSIGSVELEVGGGVSYVWSNGDVTPNTIVIESGEYTVEVTNEEGCTSTGVIDVEDCDPVRIIADPPNAKICMGQKVKLRASDGFDAYRWKKEGDDVFFSTLQEVEVATSGVYIVVAELDGSDCMPSHKKRVEITEAPEKPTISPETPTTCDTDIQVLGVWDSYQWLKIDGEDEIDMGTSSSVSLPEAGSYRVVVTRDGCETSKDFVVNETAIAITADPPDAKTCTGQKVKLRASDGFDEYRWKKEGDDVPFSTLQEVEVTTSGVYIVEAEKNGSDCMPSKEKRVEITEELDEPNISPENPTTCDTDIEVLGVWDEYLWLRISGNDEIEVGTSSSISLSEAGNYKVIVTRDGCETSKDFVVNEATVELEMEEDITECMEDRPLTFDVFTDGFGEQELTYEFIFTVDGEETRESIMDPFYMYTTPKVSSTATDHSYTLSICVIAKTADGNSCKSNVIEVKVHELWIDHFRDLVTAKDWKVRVGYAIDYKAYASPDCTAWEWEMPDENTDDIFAKVWLTTGGMSRQGDDMLITYGSLANSGNTRPRVKNSYFGDTYGTVQVSCLDGRGMEYSVLSSSDRINKKTKVFFDPDVDIHGRLSTTDEFPPCWFVFWKDGNVVEGINQCVYKEERIWGEYDRFSGNIVLGNLASDNCEGPQVLMDLDTEEPFNISSSENHLKCLAAVITHEEHHKDIFNTWCPCGGHTDTDDIPDNEETSPGTLEPGRADFKRSEPDNPDSFKFAMMPGFGEYADNADNEVRCRMLELVADALKEIYPERDWSADPFNPQW